MTKITAPTRLPGRVIPLFAAALLVGCMGTSVSSGEMEDFIPGKTTEAEIVEELGEPEPSNASGGDLTSAGATWGYLISQESLNELESYLGEGEELEQFVDLRKYLHKEYLYVGVIFTPIPLYTVSVFVFAPDGRLVQKNRVKWLKELPCDPYYDDYCEDSHDPFWDFKRSVEAVADNYMTIYEEADVARIKEELTRIKGVAKQPDAAQEQSGPAKQSPAKK